METKTCRVCEEDKETTEYHKDRVKFDGLRSLCKECDKTVRTKNGYHTIRKYSRFPIRVRDKINRFKIEEGVYYSMYAEQSGKCHVCEKHMDKLCVDHCHNTGKVRALLCHNCNAALGLMKENTEAIKALVIYSQYCNELKNV